MSLARTLLLSVAAWMICQPQAVAQPMLQYQFKECQQLHYDVFQSGAMKIGAPGVNIEVKFTMSMDVTWQVLAVSPRSRVATLAVKAERFRVDADAMGQQFVLDSANPKNDEEKDMVAALQEGIKLEMSEEGKILGIEAKEAVIGGFQKLLPFSANAGDAKIGVRYTLQPFLLTFPDAKPTKGKTWTVVQNAQIIPQAGTMKQEGQFTYEGPSKVDGKTLERLGYRMVVKLENDPKGMLQGKVNKQESKGHVLFDAAMGRLVEGKVMQIIDIELTESSGQGATLWISQDVHCKLRVPAAK
jgi:hypothetical protein